MMKLKSGSSGSLIGAVFAGIAASLCCVGPLILLLLGISGAWVSTLTILEPIRPFAILLTLGFLSVAFWQLYLKPVKCKPGAICEKPRSLGVSRLIFWIITVILLLLLMLPWYAHWFY
ncbi:TPA: mercuric transporter MerT family protein [Legionella pneumophila]